MASSLRTQVWDDAMNVEALQQAQIQEKQATRSVLSFLTSPAGIALVVTIVTFVYLLLRRPALVMRTKRSRDDETQVPKLSLVKLFGWPALAGVLTLVVPYVATRVGSCLRA